MIKTNELRIGNLVYDDKNKIASIVGITDINNHCQLVSYENNNEIQPYDWYEVFPIELNEEWLIKLGFKINTGIVNLYMYYTIGNFQISKSFAYDSRVRRFDVKYVHQLQNLYFALTGNELTISEGTDTVGTAKNRYPQL